MSSKKRIALITTWFPPQTSVATNRMIAFAEYLSEDFEVEVFALDKKKHSDKLYNCRIHYNSDNRMLRLLKSNTKDSRIIHNGKTLLRIAVSKMVKNPLRSWQKQTLKDLVKVHAANPFDLIISSYAPKEAHEVVLQFKDTFRKIPWIADMRDEMSKNPHNLPHINENLRKLESEIAKKASAITTVSEPIVEIFREVCPGVKYYEEIRNGSNHDLDLQDYDYSGDTFKIGYFGSFYGPIKPTFFMNALVAMKEVYPDFEFSFELFGAHRNFVIPAALESFVSLKPAVPYTTAIEMMAKMDALLLISPATSRKGVYTGKLFDYLSVRRSVLALTDMSDVAAKLVIETNAGYAGECNNPEENIRVITAAWKAWKDRKLNIIDKKDADLQHRKIQIDKLKKLINKILEQ